MNPEPYTHYWSLAPVWVADFIGSGLMIIIALQCLALARRFCARDPVSLPASFLLWFFAAIFAFSLCRGLGHILEHLLYFVGKNALWQRLAPVSGSINTISFVVIAAVTMFFRRMQPVMERVRLDRERLEKTSREILALNENIELMVAARTREEMSLQMAHGVRNPALVIGGLVRRLLTTAPEECLKEKNRLQRVIEEVRKLEALVNTFEQQHPELERQITPLELNALMEETIAVVSDQAAVKEIALLLDRAAASLNFQGNAQLLKSGFLHLIRNSIEACDSGNTIQISTELAEEGVVLKIQDDGPGIAADVLSHIYEPFFLTAAGETGIGIPFVKQIISEHKGAITITSQEGAGTLVKITLPTHLGSLLTLKNDYQI